MGRGLAQKTVELRAACREILSEIAPASVRAVCYQLFNRKLIPNMSKNSTAKVSRILTQAREDGMIPWHWIVDEHRSLERVPAWENPADFTRTIKHAYRRDRWQDQAVSVEVWSEKGTIRGTIEPVLVEYGVGLRVMHGFSSATVANNIANNPPNIAFYIGDWDPSGMYMSALDLPERIERYGSYVDIQRIALTAADVAGNLPSFNAIEKSADARYNWFVNHFGTRCVELDAMNPNDLRERLSGAIEAVIDRELWDRDTAVERAEIASLNEFMNNWTALSG